MSGIDYADNNTILLKAPSDITEVEIISSVRIIRGIDETNYAFQKCTNTLTTIIFEPNSTLEIIEPYAFYSCTSLEGINLSSCIHLKTISNYAFCSCSKMKYVYFPNSLTSILNYAFSSLTSLVSIELPSSLEIIGHHVFHSCLSLKICVIPRDIKITSFPQQTFYQTKLESLFIPKSVVNFGTKTVERAQNLKSIDVDPDNPVFASIDHVLFSHDKKYIYSFPAAKSKTYEIPEGVVETVGITFSVAKLTSITLPSTLMKISEYCFLEASIESIIIPNSVTTIGSYAFSKCNRLTEVTLSTNLTFLSSYCFDSCDIRSLTIPNGITAIYNNRFAKNKNLETVILPANLKTLGGGVFSECPKVKLQFDDDANIYIDSQNLILDKQNKTVIQFLGSEPSAEIHILSTVTSIGSSAFSSKTNLVSVIFDENSQLETISREAFFQCTQLKSINFPQTLTTILYKAFLNTGLTNIKLGSNLKTIDEHTFSECSSLLSVDLQETQVKSFPTKAFSSCHQLNQFLFPKTLLEIGESCFSGCAALKVIELPASIQKFTDKPFANSGIETVSFASECLLETLSSHAFYGATHLKSFAFPHNLKTIEPFALATCAIPSITLPESVEVLSMNCFSSNSELTTFIIPSGSKLLTVEKCVFEKCINLKKIESNIQKFIVDNDALVNEDRTKIIAYPPKSPTKYFYVLQSVKTIEESAFSNCINLIQVLIPEKSVQTINLRAFQNCTKLTMINIPSSVVTVGNDIFKGCKSLKCGINVDVRDDVLNSILTNTGLTRNHLKPCSIQMTCPNIVIPSAKIFGKILIFIPLLL